MSIESRYVRAATAARTLPTKELLEILPQVKCSIARSAIEVELDHRDEMERMEWINSYGRTPGCFAN